MDNQFQYLEDEIWSFNNPLLMRIGRCVHCWWESLLVIWLTFFLEACYRFKQLNSNLKPLKKSFIVH